MMPPTIAPKIRPSNPRKNTFIMSSALQRATHTGFGQRQLPV
jgi:hypothetical protein